MRACPRRQRIAAQDVSGVALRSKVALLRHQRGIEATPGRNAILPRPHIDLADHAHLQVLGRRDVAVPEIGARIGRQIVIGEAAADVDGDRGIRHAVVEGGSVGITVEVNGVLLEQVGPHDHADVGKGEEELVVFVDGHQRRGNVAVHDADVHDLARIDMPVNTSGEIFAAQLASAMQSASGTWPIAPL